MPSATTESALIVRPSGPLNGTVPISGAKNSVLKLMAAALLAPGTHVVHNVPDITDVAVMAELLNHMGVVVARDGSSLTLIVGEDLIAEAPYELVAQMRASIAVLGPLLARCGEARVALPGGDDFGPRPIDMHLRGLELLGAEFTSSRGVIEGRCDGLLGARVVLEFPSVGATENLLMAAVGAKGETIIDNAAREPEIVDLAAFLSQMGAQVAGAGSSTISVVGTERLSPAEFTVVPDRIEAATFLAATGVAGGEVTLSGARPDHLDLLCQKFGDMGIRTSPDPKGLWVFANKRLHSVDVSTLPYPGIATDFKPLIVAMLTVGDDVGIVTENLFTGRFRYIDELVRMGADVRTEGHHAVVRGVDRLSGAPVRAHDIRAGAALVVAALGADGETTIAGAEHIDRGYERFVEKLVGLGADVERVSL
jgi:UDP-N-acetylglucosamine 1-carboxyvinyltransferase